MDQIPIMLPDNLRNKKEDMAFLEKWKANLPKEVLTTGLPWNQGSQN